MSGVSSPCVRICVIDQQTGLCEGCDRTLREIAGWPRLSESERRAIMAELPERRARKDAARDSLSRAGERMG